LKENKAFWKNKKMADFSEEEWEAVCCRCGLCCLVKLQDDDTEDIYYTRVICRYFDLANKCCKEYENRCKLVPQCLKVTQNNINELEWMPKKCSYRILNETGDLPKWHPLQGGEGLSDLPKNLVYDNMVDEENVEDFIIEGESF
jgi:uncharacterized cysteine cluster protein YcgN (CxxCxxCC family)